MQKLPIGRQTFREVKEALQKGNIIEEYVDYPNPLLSWQREG